MHVNKCPGTSCESPHDRNLLHRRVTSMQPEMPSMPHLWPHRAHTTMDTLRAWGSKGASSTDSIQRGYALICSSIKPPLLQQAALISLFKSPQVLYLLAWRCARYLHVCTSHLEFISTFPAEAAFPATALSTLP